MSRVSKNERSKKQIGPKVSFVDLELDPSIPRLNSSSQRNLDKPVHTDPLLDPAKQVLLCTQEAKKKRQQAELQLALDKIHQRVDYTLHEYEGPKLKTPSQIEATNKEANIEVIEDPAYLYELLGDSTQRTKYQQKLTVFVLGYEEKCDSRERLLSSLQDFFLENQAGGTERLLDELEGNEYDLDDATSGLESAMDTAQNAAQRLLAIKQEMSKLIAIVAAYPDTKKGRKKLEKALLKAQEEVENLSSNLEQVQSELEESRDQLEVVQKQVELKSQECTKLKAEADKVKFLQVGKDKVSNELKTAQAEIESLKQELEDMKALVPTKSEMIVKTTTVAVDRKKTEELEEQLAQEKERCAALLAEKEELESQHNEELEAMREDYEAEMDEIRASYEEQLKSLMEDELFPDYEEENSISEGNELYPEDSRKDGLELHIEEEPSDAVGNALSRPTSENGTENLTKPVDSEDGGSTCPAPEESDQVSPAAKDSPQSAEGHEARPTEEQVPDDKAPTVPNPPAESESLADSRELKQDNSKRPPTTDQTTTPPMDTDAPPTDVPVVDTGTSGSESGASTPRRSRRGSVATRRQSLVGRKRGSVSGPDGARRESVANSVLDKLKTEFESREKKLRQEIDDLKAKSRKTITALRAQIAVAQNKESGELDAARNEIKKFESRVNALEGENADLEERIVMLESEKANLSKELLETRSELENQVSLVKQLEERLQVIQENQQSGSDGVRPVSNTLVERSAQWSEGEISGQTTETTPLIQINAVETLLPSTPNGSKEGTAMNPSIPEAPGPSPLSGSVVMDNPLTSLPLQSTPLASRHRLSQPPTAELTHDHPVVMEWAKVCEGVRVLRDSLVEVLCVSAQFPSVVNDLTSVAIHSIDRSQDVCSEVTSSRVSVSLLLHQLTVSLTEVLTELTADGGECVPTESGEEEMRVTVERLKRKLRGHNDTRHVMMKESKEKIASLSCQVSSLRSELASLKQSLALSRTNRDRVVMFTRLDSQRNTQTLKATLEKNKISLSAYNKVTTAMNDYLAIAGHGLASLSQQISASTHTKQLVKHVQHHYGASPKASQVLDKLSQLEQRKKLEFSVHMDQLRLRRLDLAHTLTHTLQHIEKHCGVFLIKPVFYKSVGLGAQSLLYPISRPLPVKKPKAQSRSQVATPHPNMKLVNELIQHSRQNEGAANAPLSDNRQQTSHTTRTLHTPHTPPHTFTGNELKWSVESSRPVSRAEDFVNPLAPPILPVHPKIVEIDIRRHRHHQSLLRDILPCPHQVSANQAIHRIPLPPKPVSPPAPSSEEKVVKSQSKVIPSQSSGMLAPITMRVEFEFPSTHAPLPPIDNCTSY